MNGVTIEKLMSVHSDERGTITDLLNKEIGHVGMITTTKGTVRGNHYHMRSTQYSYILSGKFQVVIAELHDLIKTETVVLEAGDLITIQPYVVHSFKALEDAVMIDMISESREGKNYENDVIKGLKLQ